MSITTIKGSVKNDSGNILTSRSVVHQVRLNGEIQDGVFKGGLVTKTYSYNDSDFSNGEYSHSFQNFITTTVDTVATGGAYAGGTYYVQWLKATIIISSLSAQDSDIVSISLNPSDYTLDMPQDIGQGQDVTYTRDFLVKINENTYTISGTVYNKTDGKGLPGIEVQYQGSNTTNCTSESVYTVLKSGITDSSGNFNMTVVGPDPLNCSRVTAILPFPYTIRGKEFRYLTGLSFADQSSAQNIYFEATIPINTYTISGYTKRSSQLGISATVKLQKKNGEAYEDVEYVITPANGFYSFSVSTSLEPDSFRVFVLNTTSDDIESVSPEFLYFNQIASNYSNQNFLLSIDDGPPPNTAYTLTTSVNSGQGTISQPGCDGDPKGVGESCSADFNGNESITLTATPSDGWVVSGWSSSIPGVFSSFGPDNLTANMSMPFSNVDVTVSFTNIKVNLISQVGSGQGCIGIISPSGYPINCSGGSVSLSAETVRMYASPLSGWAISSWVLDGVTQSHTDSIIDFSLLGYSPSRTIVVNFEEEGDCDTNILNVTIEGSGSVSPPSGSYCEDSTLYLRPIPSTGYEFKEWTYDDQSGIVEDGILLLVPMDIARSVTATFQSIVGANTTDLISTLFYCPSETYKASIIEFDFVNNLSSPSNYDDFHFRVNFYSDASKTKLIHSAFSLSDNKRWFYNYTSFNQIPESGVIVLSGETVTISYDPEILPHELTENQKPHLINNGTYETPLVCGVKYYVDIESYSLSNNSIDFLETVSIILDCNDVDSFKWGHNKDINTWLCSGQGGTDLMVTNGNNQSIFSMVSSNLFDIFHIVWQERRSGSNAIYGAVWESDKDILHSSGQGFYDKEVLRTTGETNIPIFLIDTITDQANNFYITGQTKDKIWYMADPFPVGVDISSDESDGGITLFEKFCYPGVGSYLDSSYNSIKVRVYNEDISDSLVINKNKVVPVVIKQKIRFDIDGVQGAYAVRIRNSESIMWGDWINIDSNLYYGGADPFSIEDDELITSTDSSYDSYRIDNSRFIVPWSIDKINGLRRVCIQVLTLYGITNTYCVEMFVNFDSVENIYKFYYIDSDLGRTEFPKYKGQYVLSLKEDSQGGLISEVEFDVLFSEDIYKDNINKIPYDDGDIKFNIVQQGINDIWGLSLSRGNDNKTFNGSFNIFEHDGVFNKDGKGFIELVFPDSIQSSLYSCNSDNSDLYNLMISDREISENKDLVPESVFEKNKKNKISKALDINSFKQYYNQDDINFKFGNPGIFKNI